MPGAETRRLVLRYDAGLTIENSWRLLDSNDGISCKARIGGISYYGEIPMRWRMLPSGVDVHKAAKRIFVAPSDEDRKLWISQPAVVARGLLPLELQLEQAPDHAIAVMSDW